MLSHDSEFKGHKKILKDCPSDACPLRPTPQPPPETTACPQRQSASSLLCIFLEIFYANRSVCIHIFLVFLSPFGKKQMLYILPFALFTDNVSWSSGYLRT